MSDDNNKDQRAKIFMRVLLENIGGLLALISVIFAAGKGWSKLDTVTTALAHITAQQEIQGGDIGTVKTDIAVLKVKVSAIEAKPAQGK